jgi:methylglutaconyl-CoA hydratase
MTDQPVPESGEPTFADPLVQDPAPDADGDAVLLHVTPEGVATVTINRPAKRNAIDRATIDELREAFETLQNTDHVRVCFLRGAGQAFCAGADLEWMRDSVDWSESDNRDDALGLARMLKTLHDMPALTVALVNGAAFGGGAGLAAACDMAIATQAAKFAFSEVKLGLIPATISPYVVDAIGPRHAKALFCTGRIFDAEHAHEIGLVQSVVADVAAMRARAQQIVVECMAAAPEAVRESKKLVWDVWGKPIDDGLIQDTAKRIAKKRVSAEGQEGVRAFLEKRKPNWTTPVE